MGRAAEALNKEYISFKQHGVFKLVPQQKGMELWWENKSLTAYSTRTRPCYGQLAFFSMRATSLPQS
jgi:hypothetical protein